MPPSPRTHWPLRSGYFESSKAWALFGISSTARTPAQVEFRSHMLVLLGDLDARPRRHWVGTAIIFRFLRTAATIADMIFRHNTTQSNKETMAISPLPWCFAKYFSETGG